MVLDVLAGSSGQLISRPARIPREKCRRAGFVNLFSKGRISATGTLPCSTSQGQLPLVNGDFERTVYFKAAPFFPGLPDKVPGDYLFGFQLCNPLVRIGSICPEVAFTPAKPLQFVEIDFFIQKGKDHIGSLGRGKAPLYQLYFLFRYGFGHRGRISVFHRRCF